jgi:hypothetical protein
MVEPKRRLTDAESEAMEQVGNAAFMRHLKALEPSLVTLAQSEPIQEALLELRRHIRLYEGKGLHHTDYSLVHLVTGAISQATDAWMVATVRADKRLDKAFNVLEGYWTSDAPWQAEAVS